MPANSRSTSASVSDDAEHRAEALREVLLGQLAALEPPQLRQRARVLAEEVPDRIRVEPLLLAERLERIEDVRRQDAAEVDEQALHEREIWSAASASAGTPSTNRPRYSSSEAPAWKRLRLPSMNTAAFQSASAWYQLSADIERPVRSS